jgi:hypothetical protein
MPPYARWVPPDIRWGSDMEKLCTLGILPYKIYPNWKISLEISTAKKLKLSQFHCSPLIRLYPFGAVAYQIRIRMKSQKGIDLDSLINLTKQISQEKVLFIKNVKFSLKDIVLALHAKLQNDIIGEEASPEVNLDLLEFHRIITLNEVEPGLDPIANQGELVALITNGENQAPLQVSAVQCKLAPEQFILFRPECMIFYPAKYPQNSKNKAFRARLRNNLESVLEFAKLERALVSGLSSGLSRMQMISKCRFDSIQDKIAAVQNQEETIVHLRESLETFNPNSDRYWRKYVHGIHWRLLSTTINYQSWKPPLTAKLLSDIEQYEDDLTMSSLTPDQDEAINQIVSDINDALVTIDKLDNVDAFGIKNSDIANFKQLGERLKNELIGSYDNINEIDRNRGTRRESLTDGNRKDIAFDTIRLDFQDYIEKFLPSYEKAIVPLVKVGGDVQPSTQQPSPNNPPPQKPDTQTQISAATTKPTNPAPNSSDVAQAQQFVSDALTAKSKLQQTYDSIGKFWKDANANKYVHGLIDAARAILHAYGIPI